MEQIQYTTKAAEIKKLNDYFRKTFLSVYGDVVMTRNFASLPNEIRTEAIRRIKNYSNEEFGKPLWKCKEDEDTNNPYGENDYGSFKVEGYKITFKIDYYDRETFPRYGSENPDDLKETKRLMTIMLSNEY